MSISKILVTGSSGTIGTALAERLLSDGYDIYGVDSRRNRWSEKVDNLTTTIDLRSSEELGELPGEIDTIVHLAAHARVHKLVENPDRARENFDMTFNILEYARKNGIENIVLASSREVYGNNNKYIYDEEDTYIDECESPYTASKIGSEAITKSYQNCYNINSSILRFSNVYGRYDASDRVVPLFISQAMENEDLVVFGDNKVLDFTYIDDCVNGIYKVLSNFEKAKNTTFNIASGTGSSLVELAKLVLELTNGEGKVEVEQNRTGEVSKYVADISKAKSVIGYQPEYPFAEGIRRSAEWYKTKPELRTEILNRN